MSCGMILAKAQRPVRPLPLVPLTSGPLAADIAQLAHLTQAAKSMPMFAVAAAKPQAAGCQAVSGHPLATLAQTSASRVAAFEAAIQANPYDTAAWEGRITEAVREGKPQAVFERAVKQFPTAARFWMNYAEWSELQDTPSASSVYRRCLNQLPNLEIWQAYLNFCKRRLPLEDIFRAYQNAVDLLGTDSRAGHLWLEYMSLLRKAYNLLQKKINPDAEVSGRLLPEDPNPIETARRLPRPQVRKLEDEKVNDLSDEAFLRAGEAIQLDVAFLRATYQRAVVTAHGIVDKLWVGYEQFEKSLGNSPLASKFLSDYMPRYLKAKAIFKELQTIIANLDFFTLAVPITPRNAKQQQQLLEAWQAFIRFERSNPLRLSRAELNPRVSLVFQQALLCCAFHVEVWHEFASWLDLCGDYDKGTACLRQGSERFLPQDLTLRLLIAHRCELAQVPLTPEGLQVVDDEYVRLLEDAPKPCALALINYLSYIRRQRGASEFRDAFLEASESSPHCTWELYAFTALVEYHVFGSVEAAVTVFRLGLERYGEREPSLLVAYVNFLSGINDFKCARAELARGILDRMQVGVREQLANRSDKMVRESLSFLWQKWTRMDRYFGDVASIRRAAAFRDEEYRNLQRDQDVEDELVAETPLALGLSASIAEVQESFRFLHLMPHSVRADMTQGTSVDSAMAIPVQQPWAVAKSGTSATDITPATAASPSSAETVAATTATAIASPSSAETAASPQDEKKKPDLTDGKKSDFVDYAISEAREGHMKFGGTTVGGELLHIARPDVSKMLSYRPALDAVNRKRLPATETEQQAKLAGDELGGLPVMIPKCLQDLLAILPTRPLKGVRPDVDYLLTVLQTVTIPPIPMKELEDFRYDSLRLAKEDDNSLLSKLLARDELEGVSGFFTTRPTLYRERLHAKRQKVQAELSTTKKEE